MHSESVENHGRLRLCALSELISTGIYEFFTEKFLRPASLEPHPVPEGRNVYMTGFEDQERKKKQKWSVLTVG